MAPHLDFIFSQHQITGLRLHFFPQLKSHIGHLRELRDEELEQNLQSQAPGFTQVLKNPINNNLLKPMKANHYSTFFLSVSMLVWKAFYHLCCCSVAITLRYRWPLWMLSLCPEWTSFRLSGIAGTRAVWKLACMQSQRQCWLSEGATEVLPSWTRIGISSSCTANRTHMVLNRL